MRHAFLHHVAEIEWLPSKHIGLVLGNFEMNWLIFHWIISLGEIPEYFSDFFRAIFAGKKFASNFTWRTCAGSERELFLLAQRQLEFCPLRRRVPRRAGSRSCRIGLEPASLCGWTARPESVWSAPRRNVRGFSVSLDNRKDVLITWKPTGKNRNDMAWLWSLETIQWSEQNIDGKRNPEKCWVTQ